MRFKRGFTLIELLVSIAIIGLLLALLIPNIDRSLSKNRVANDAELFQSKLEQTRLLAASTQAKDELQSNSATVTDAVGYYGLYLPASTAGDSHNYFSLVRLSYPFTNGIPCTAQTVETQVTNSAGGECVVERVELSQGVDLDLTCPHIIAYRVPIQQLTELRKGGSACTNGNWQEVSPTFDSWNFRLLYKDKTATVSLGAFTAKVTIGYTSQ